MRVKQHICNFVSITYNVQAHHYTLCILPATYHSFAGRFSWTCSIYHLCSDNDVTTKKKKASLNVKICITLNTLLVKNIKFVMILGTSDLNASGQRHAFILLCKPEVFLMW